MPTIDNHLYESSFQYNHLDGTDYLGTREAELIKLQEVWDFCRICLLYTSPSPRDS